MHNPLTNGEKALIEFLDTYLPGDDQWKEGDSLLNYKGWLIFAQPFLNEKYYDWLCQFVYDETNSFHNSYKRLLKDLYSREFYWKMVMDENRAKDGVALRDRYEFDTHIPSGKEGSCSVLEMMIALAIRCEEHIMGDPNIGIVTGKLS